MVENKAFNASKDNRKIWDKEFEYIVNERLLCQTAQRPPLSLIKEAVKAYNGEDNINAFNNWLTKEIENAYTEAAPTNALAKWLTEDRFAEQRSDIPRCQMEEADAMEM